MNPDFSIIPDVLIQAQVTELFGKIKRSGLNVINILSENHVFA